METTVQHFVIYTDGAIIEAASCAEAREGAGGGEGVRWWLEWGHYGPGGEPVAGGEWPCGCGE